TKGRKTGTSAATTDHLPEGVSNLYFTAQRVRDTVLTALSTATNAVITAADTVLSALGKLQAQVSANLTAIGLKADKSITISTTAPLTGGGDLSANRTLAISAATTVAPGSMSAADKTKLDGVATGATAYTDANARAAVVIDSIADADIDHAPSRNAVFDALALKQPLDAQLTDLAALTYAGNALKVLRVKATEDGWELSASSGGGGATLGANTFTESQTIDTSATLSAEASLTFNTNLGAYQGLKFKSDNNLLWWFTPDGVNPAAGNAGMDFTMFRYGNLGNYLGRVFVIRRSDGRISFETEVNFDSEFGLTLNRPAGQAADFNWRTAGVQRWLWRKESATDDLRVARYSDAGGFLGWVVRFTRATGVVDFTEAPTIPTLAAGTNTTQAATTAFVAAAVGADSGWVAPTLLNSWANFGAPFATAGYRKISKVVYLRGLVAGGMIADGTTLMTLPVGYRPTATRMFFVKANTGHCRIDVEAGGNVIINNMTGNSGFLSLDPIVFQID
ncbi:MAG: hypothetical protein M3R16_06785, partial [Pseudomonadota bacterium]|nr:hypothetical protein [Pseudomonadota bacterium]